jgi:hypothetical protein
VLSGTLRVLTHPRVFDPRSPPAVPRAYVAALRSTPNALIVAPGPRHWQLLTGLIEQSGAIGNTRLWSAGTLDSAIAYSARAVAIAPDEPIWRRSLGANYFRPSQPGPRNTVPGLAPVNFPFSSTTTPFTST